jgi:hypothetical protein
VHNYLLSGLVFSLPGWSLGTRTGRLCLPQDVVRAISRDVRAGAWERERNNLAREISGIAGYMFARTRANIFLLSAIRDLCGETHFSRVLA